MKRFSFLFLLMLSCLLFPGCGGSQPEKAPASAKSIRLQTSSEALPPLSRQKKLIPVFLHRNWMFWTE